MKRAFALILAGCLLAAGLWSPASASHRAQAPRADAPQLVHAVNGWASGETMDPAINYDTAGGQFLAQIYDTLVLPPRAADSIEYIPNLAAGWDISQDGLTYTFYLRGGVHFSNGAVLTPEDVAYTFRRGLLNGGTFSPQWLLFEPLLGSRIYNDIAVLVDPTGSLVDDPAALQQASPARLLAACNKVEQAVAYDLASGTVTFHLAQKWNPFLETLTGPWGSILNKAWVVDLGGWDGSCTTWQNYYATGAYDSPLAEAVNGTGPYNLAELDSSGTARLVSKPDYWRSDPMWPGGPTGVAYFTTVLMQNVSDSTERREMLLDGTAQLADLNATDYDLLNEQVLLAYPPGSQEGTLMYPAGILKSYKELSASTTDGLFNYDIRTGGPRNYIGTGSLGSGIPVNFFTDIHVRKAFNYAFDWETWIADATDGNAVQRRGVIPEGFAGFSNMQPVYSLDLAKAAQEFNLAWNGQVASQGFTLTISYNTGNVARQRAYEILKENIETLAPGKYHVNLLGLDLNTYRTDFGSRYIPFALNGWLADYRHPHNFVYTYLATGGVFSSRQSLPESMRAIFDPKIAECVTASLEEMQACYEELQNMSYEYAVALWGMQAYPTTYTRAEIQGYYRPLAASLLYYTLSEAPLPVVGDVLTGEPAAIPFSDPRGATGEAIFPAGAFDQEAQIVIAPGKVVGDMTSGFRFGGLTFDINAFGPDGAKLEANFDPASPVEIVIHFDPADVAGISENTLRLRYWNGATWEDAGCGEPVIDLEENTLTVPLCHFSEYALAGYPLRYLPLAAGGGLPPE